MRFFFLPCLLLVAKNQTPLNYSVIINHFENMMENVADLRRTSAENATKLKVTNLLFRT